LPSVDDKLELDRGLDGKLAGLRALEDAIDVSSRAPKLVDEIGTVGDESAGGDVKAAGKDRGQSVLRGQRDDQIAMNDRQCSDRNSRRRM
jgi:hypothetical protein